MKVVVGFIAAVCAVIWGLSGVAGCQETPHEHNWDLAVWVVAATGEENTNSFGESQIVSAGPFVGKIFTRQSGDGWLQGNLEYGFSVSPLFFQIRPQHLHGVAFEPIILRWNSVHAPHGIIPYIELAGGGVRTNVNLPAGNTSDFNFTASGGGGFYLLGKSHREWDLGARWLHISNANLGIQNPELNGVQIRVAYHWFP